MNKILVLAGPSAVGKTTVMNEIISVSGSFEYIRSATTRAPRGDEYDSEYIYLSEREFRERIDSGEMLEYTEFGGNFYGTPNSEIERVFACGKTPLLILDINGVTTLKSRSFAFETVAIYITADIDVLDKRLYERTIASGNTNEALKVFEKRKAQNRRDLSNLPEISKLFDLTVVNTTVSETAKEILSFFEE